MRFPKDCPADLHAAMTRFADRRSGGHGIHVYMPWHEIIVVLVGLADSKPYEVCGRSVEDLIRTLDGLS